MVRFDGPSLRFKVKIAEVFATFEEWSPHFSLFSSEVHFSQGSRYFEYLSSWSYFFPNFRHLQGISMCSSQFLAVAEFSCFSQAVAEFWVHLSYHRVPSDSPPYLLKWIKMRALIRHIDETVNCFSVLWTLNTSIPGNLNSECCFLFPFGFIYNIFFLKIILYLFERGRLSWGRVREREREKESSRIPA